MDTNKERQSHAARRGCLWLIAGAPSLLLVYLVLLSTSLFDSRPTSYPDLDIPTEAPTIPLMEALEASPEWIAWKANEDARDEWLVDLRRESPSLPAEELRDKFGPELANAIKLASSLNERPEQIGSRPWPEEVSPLDVSFEDAAEFRRIFATLRTAPWFDTVSGSPGDACSRVSPLALQLLAKARPLGNSLIGRFVWLTSESCSHEVLCADLRNSVIHRDAEKLRRSLADLSACRPPGDPSMANTWKAEFQFSRNMVGYMRRQLGKFGAGVTAFGSSTSASANLQEQWTLLRLQPNRCASLLADDTRSRIRNSTLPARDRVWPPPLARNWRTAVSPAPNAGGEVLLAIASPSYEKAFEVEDHGLARHHLLRLLIGLSLYRIDHGGSLPSDLGALVPAYLPEIPKDPYTGEPPIYEPAAGKIAFRGLDFVPSPPMLPTEKEKAARQRGLPPGTSGLFNPAASLDPGVDLRAFFE